MNPTTAASHQPGRTRSRGFARAGRTVAGGLLLLVGAALLVLPGPGLLVIAAGLAVLAVDYHWPRRLLDRVRERLAAARRRVLSQDRNPTYPEHDRRPIRGESG